MYISQKYINDKYLNEGIFTNKEFYILEVFDTGMNGETWVIKDNKTNKIIEVLSGIKKLTNNNEIFPVGRTLSESKKNKMYSELRMSIDRGRVFYDYNKILKNITLSKFDGFANTTLNFATEYKFTSSTMSFLRQWMGTALKVGSYFGLIFTSFLRGYDIIQKRKINNYPSIEDASDEEFIDQYKDKLEYTKDKTLMSIGDFLDKDDLITNTMREKGYNKTAKFFEFYASTNKNILNIKKQLHDGTLTKEEAVNLVIEDKTFRNHQIYSLITFLAIPILINYSKYIETTMYGKRIN